MIFTVVWTQTAEDELALICVCSPHRESVTQAARSLDQLLKHQAEFVGRSHGDYRLLSVPPLVIAFAVCPADRLVRCGSHFGGMIHGSQE